MTQRWWVEGLGYVEPIAVWRGLYQADPEFGRRVLESSQRAVENLHVSRKTNTALTRPSRRSKRAVMPESVKPVTPSEVQRIRTRGSEAVRIQAASLVPAINQKLETSYLVDVPNLNYDLYLAIASIYNTAGWVVKLVDNQRDPLCLQFVPPEHNR